VSLVGSDPQSVANAFINKDGLVVNVLADPAHGVAEDPIKRLLPDAVNLNSLV
jgi:hypothetical protein